MRICGAFTRPSRYSGRLELTLLKSSTWVIVYCIKYVIHGLDMLMRLKILEKWVGFVKSRLGLTEYIMCCVLFYASYVISHYDEFLD